MIFKLSHDKSKCHHMDDMSALMALVAHLHIALFYMQESYSRLGLDLSLPLKEISTQTAHVLNCAEDIKKG